MVHAIDRRLLLLMDLFEVISEDEFVAETSVTPVLTAAPTAAESAFAEVAGVTKVYCDFCKGYYNEYHFGDIDEPSR